MFVYGIKVGINLNSQTQGSPKHMSSAFTKIFRKLKETKIYFRRKFLSIVIKMQKKICYSTDFSDCSFESTSKKDCPFHVDATKTFLKKKVTNRITMN